MILIRITILTGIYFFRQVILITFGITILNRNQLSVIFQNYKIIQRNPEKYIADIELKCS